MKKKKEVIMIPDEYIPDFSLSKEEQKKQWEKWKEKSNKAFKKLFKK